MQAAISNKQYNLMLKKIKAKAKAKKALRKLSTELCIAIIIDMRKIHMGLSAPELRKHCIENCKEKSEYAKTDREYAIAEKHACCAIYAQCSSL